jgi:hypothetical protein
VGAPFSADAVTTVRQTHAGKEIRRVGVARYYRDIDGHVRIEQLLSTGAMRVTLDSMQYVGMVYTVNKAARSLRLGPRSIAALAVGGGSTFSIPLGEAQFRIFDREPELDRRVQDESHSQEPIGVRQEFGLEVRGYRLTALLETNQGSLRVTEERWESPVLGILVEAHYSDPRVAIIDYAVTNVSLSAPPADLFNVPSGFTVDTLEHGKSWIRLESRDGFTEH